MEELASFTGKDGELLPAKVINKPKATKKLSLKIVPPKPVVVNVSDDDDSGLSTDDFDESDNVSSESSEEGFYVEMSLSCTNDDGEQENHYLVFNFETEQNYMDHAESGYEDMEDYFEEAIATNLNGWTYDGEFEENDIFGPDAPDYDGVIVNVI